MSASPPRPEVCVGAVVVRDACLLLVRRGHGPAAGTWSIPGGRVEPGETLAEAVVREVAEETGLAVVCGPFLGWVERLTEQHHHVVMDFEAVLLGGERPVAGDDAAEAAWVPLGDVVDRELVDGLAEFLVEVGVLDVLA